MERSTRSRLTDDEWTVVREFTETDDGDPLPRYEAKFVADAETRHFDDEIVLVRETDPTFGGERLYQFPRPVFEGVVDRLPDP